VSIQPRPDGGEFRQQDAQVIQADHDGCDPHPEWRWRERVNDDEWTVRAAWRDGEPVTWPGDGYARYHDDTGTMLIAEWGIIQTVIHVDDVERPATQDAIREFKEGLLEDGDGS
jgi:hypothetical protein